MPNRESDADHLAAEYLAKHLTSEQLQAHAQLCNDAIERIDRSCANAVGIDGADVEADAPLTEQQLAICKSMNCDPQSFRKLRAQRGALK